MSLPVEIGVTYYVESARLDRPDLTVFAHIIGNDGEEYSVRMQPGQTVREGLGVTIQPDMTGVCAASGVKAVRNRRKASAAAARVHQVTTPEPEPQAQAHYYDPNAAPPQAVMGWVLCLLGGAMMAYGMFSSSASDIDPTVTNLDKQNQKTIFAIAGAACLVCGTICIATAKKP